MSSLHEGVVLDAATYTTRAIARIVGIKQARTVEIWLDEIGCPVKRLGSRVFVSGREFRAAIERNSQPIGQGGENDAA